MKRNNLRVEREHQRKERNRKYILQAAERVFAQKGFGPATVDEIAAEAQFSKATLYRYFSSKNEIFSEIIKQSFLDIRQDFLKIKKLDQPAQHKLYEIIRIILTHQMRKKRIARIFFVERSAMKKALKIDINHHVMSPDKIAGIPEDFVRIIEEISDVIQSVIAEGIASGEFREVDVRDAGHILGGLVRGFPIGGVLGRREYSLEESTRLLHDFFINGIKVVHHP